MSALYPVLAGLSAVVLLALLYGRQSRKRGRAEADRANLKSAVETAGKAGEIDEDVARLPDDALYRELHGNDRE